MVNQGTNIKILTSARSGSTLLHTLLSSHSQLHCEWEIFNYRELKKQYPLWFVKVIRRLPMFHIAYRMRKFKKVKPFYGFKIFTNQLRDIPHVIQQLQHKNFKLICFKRNNKIKQAISFVIAIERDKWMVNNEKDYTNEVIQLSPEKVLKYLIRYIEMDEQIRTMAAPFNPIWVDYEAELLNNENRAAFSSRICRELGFAPESLSSNVLTTDKRPDDERIKNLNEILDFIANQGYPDEVLYYNQFEKK